MTDKPHPLDLEATMKRMEPGVCAVAHEFAWVSIAISMRDISLTMQRMENNQLAILSELRALSSAVSVMRNDMSGMNSVGSSILSGTTTISQSINRLKDQKP